VSPSSPAWLARLLAARFLRELRALCDEPAWALSAREIVQSHGKQTIGWDEIAPAPLLPTTIVQHWRPRALPREAVEKQARLRRWTALGINFYRSPQVPWVE
jgi:hypothetical protein